MKDFPVNLGCFQTVLDNTVLTHFFSPQCNKPSLQTGDGGTEQLAGGHSGLNSGLLYVCSVKNYAMLCH